MKPCRRRISGIFVVAALVSNGVLLSGCEPVENRNLRVKPDIRTVISPDQPEAYQEYLAGFGCRGLTQGYCVAHEDVGLLQVTGFVLKLSPDMGGNIIQIDPLGKKISLNLHLNRYDQYQALREALGYIERMQDKCNMLVPADCR